MQSLYVCLFSNGHIKVGRSDKPFLRIAAHADRVSCLGVTLTDQRIFECVGRASLAEAKMIQRCAAVTTQRNAVEWFEGVNFLDAVAWAQELAAVSRFVTAYTPGIDGMKKADAIQALGGTPKKAAHAMGYTSVHAIYMWPDVLRPSVAERVVGIVTARKAKQQNAAGGDAE